MRIVSKRCCFAGHSKIYDDFQEKLKAEIENLIKNKDVREFWAGNYGDFDYTAAKIIKELKKVHTDIKLCLVLPYTTKIIDEKRQEYYEKFDAILIADMPDNTPSKYRIIKCNEYMINKSDFLLCYVKFSWGGASKTLQYAEKKKHIEIVNIAMSRY